MVGRPGVPLCSAVNPKHCVVVGGYHDDQSVLSAWESSDEISVKFSCHSDGKK